MGLFSIDLLTTPVLAGDSKSMPPTKAFVCGDRDDPLAAALEVSGVDTGTPRNFRMVGADGSVEVSLATRSCGVWALGHSPIQADVKRDWRMGGRLGPNASGDG